MIAFPLSLLAVLLVLVSLGITGSSTGILSQFFSTQPDPDLIAGQPQAIRSDEWLVQTTLVISQVEQGLPIDSETLPGGVDATVQSDLPTLDWSTIFRPHLLGFTFLPLDNAMSLRWWLPGFAMMASLFFFLVSMMPRRVWTSAIVAVGFFFQPFFQWWFLPITFWPAVWCFLACAAAVWLIRWPERRVIGIAISALAGYCTVTMVIGVYVPFIIPSILVAVAFILGLVLMRSPERLGRRLVRLWPLIAAGALGGMIVGIWLLTRLNTIERFLGTVYPGQRLSPPGALDYRGFLSLLAAPFSRRLGDPVTDPLDANASEASTFFLVGLILFIPLLWFAVVRWRRWRRMDWMAVALTVLALVFAAYLVVPGWGPFSKLLLLDRTTAERLRIGIGLLSVVVIAVLGSRFDELSIPRRARSRVVLATVVGVTSLLYVIGMTVLLSRIQSNLISGSPVWIATCAAFCVAAVLFASDRFLPAAAALLAATLATSGGVNPIYVGVYDLNDTEVMAVMKTLPDVDDADWVGIGGGYLPTAVLVQSGLRAFNGFQSAPPDRMWDEIDPDGRYEQQWNRLANVSWSPGEGEPEPVNTQPDTIVMNFDSCSAFAQEYVEYVLSDIEVEQECMSEIDVVTQGPTTFRIYAVDSAG